MKKHLRFLFLAATCIAVLPQTQAQKNTAFAITGATKGNLNWTVLREIDLGSGALVRNIYIPSSQKPAHLNAATGKAISEEAAGLKGAPEDCACASGLSAASAYDATHNRLYFTNLEGSELQYIDLNQPQLKIYHVQHQKIKQFVSQPGEGDNITRMVFGSDGFGYALTNNGNHLVRFSTGKNINITDLGSLRDGDGNSDISVHAQTASWGGDLVADDGGNLYLFTVGAHVFKIIPSAMTAHFVGTIHNLPALYSVNAAAVNKSGQVVVSSSLDASQYFQVDMSSLEATPIWRQDDKLFNASDFANGNFIACGDNREEFPATQAKVPDIKSVSIFPNPVKNKMVQVYFNNVSTGKSMIEIAEMTGKKIANSEIFVTAKAQYQTLRLPGNTAPGMYVVRVLNADKTVFSQTVMVE